MVVGGRVEGAVEWSPVAGGEETAEESRSRYSNYTRAKKCEYKSRESAHNAEIESRIIQ